jgi:hypothetical protein
MLHDLENYYLKHPEPIQGCLLALKNIILCVNREITQRQQYQIPFFYYKGKKLCFLWVNKKKLLLGFVVDKTILPVVTGVKRKDEMETIEIYPREDLPVQIIQDKILQLIKLYD